MYRLALRSPQMSALQRALQQQRLCRLYSKSGGHNGLPPNVREAGFGKVVFYLSPIIAVGGVITYAKYDKDFRKMVEKNVPGSDKVFKFALQEEDKPFRKFVKQLDAVTEQFDSAAKWVEDTKTTVTEFFGGEGKTEKREPPKKPRDDPPPPPPPKKTAYVEVNNKPATTPAASESIPAATKAGPASAAPAPAPPTPVADRIMVKPEDLPRDVIELEKAVEIAASLAVKEYNRAISILKTFNNDVRKVVDQAVENVDTSLWTTLKNKTSARDTSVATAEKLAHEATEKIGKCEIALSKVTNDSNHDAVMAVRSKIKTLVEHIDNVKDELYKNKDIASVSEKYWRNVEKARNYFIDEIESIFPGLNLSEKQLNLSKEDVDLFIMHAYSHVLAYQKELNRLQTDGELRLKRAIDAYRGTNDTEAVKAQIEYHLEAEKRKLAIENQRKIFQIRSDTEKQLRHQLKQQAEAHVDHLTDAIAMKENEIKRNYGRELEDKLASERANYKLQLAAMVGKMRGMDAALQARAESERSAHQAQALWAACQALWATVRTGEPGVHWKSKLRPLRNEIKAISKVGEGDELVAVVIENLPPEAESRGVFPEDALRERFLNVERVARKLARVPEQGASLPMYVLSYLQSLFVMTPTDPISSDELQDKKFDFSKLDTYDILNRARYYVDRGNLLQALKYMNLLQGAPRKIASDWLKETRLLLETQQAANTLMAHAAASGLLYL